jgi:hypothetical protein
MPQRTTYDQDDNVGGGSPVVGGRGCPLGAVVISKGDTR